MEWLLYWLIAGLVSWQIAATARMIMRHGFVSVARGLFMAILLGPLALVLFLYMVLVFERIDWKTGKRKTS